MHMKRLSFLSIVLALMLTISNIFVTDVSNTLNPGNNYEIVYAAPKSSGAAGGYKSGNFSNSKKSTTKSDGYKSGSFSNSKGSSSNAKDSTSSSSSSKKEYHYSSPSTNTKNGVSDYSKQKIQKKSNSGTGSANYYKNYGNGGNSSNGSGKVNIVQDMPVEDYETSAENATNVQTDNTPNKNIAATKNLKTTSKSNSSPVKVVSITVIIIAGILLIRHFISKNKRNNQ